MNTTTIQLTAIAEATAKLSVLAARGAEYADAETARLAEQLRDQVRDQHVALVNAEDVDDDVADWADGFRAVAEQAAGVVFQAFAASPL